MPQNVPHWRYFLPKIAYYSLKLNVDIIVDLLNYICKGAKNCHN